MTYYIFSRLENPFNHIILCMIIFLFTGFLQATELSAQRKNEHACEKECTEEGKNDQKHTNETEGNHKQDVSFSEGSLKNAVSENELYENLLKQWCEHDVSIIKCDDCRYEVGVVKVDASVLGEVVSVGYTEPFDVGITIEATGKVATNQDFFVIVSPRISGVVREVHVDWGESVTKGQNLVVLDSIELGEASAYYLKSIAKLKLAEKNYERELSLYQQNITSKKHFLGAENTLEQAQIEQKAAKEKLLLLGLPSGDIQKMTESEAHVSSLFTITAPFDGTVIDKKVAVGELKNAFDPTLTIADLTHLWIWFDIYEKDISKVKMDSKVTVSVAAYPEERFEGCVTYIGNTIDEKTRTVKVRAEVGNQHKKLKPGMFARILLQVDEAACSVGLPEAAVQADGHERFVFVPLKDGYFIRRNVTIGPRLNGYVKVINSLAVNDRVVVKGGFLLKSEIMKEKFGEGCGGH